MLDPKDINKVASALKLKLKCVYLQTQASATRWEAEIAYRSYIFIGSGRGPEAALKQAFRQLWDDLYDKLEADHPPSVADAVVRLKR